MNAIRLTALPLVFAAVLFSLFADSRAPLAHAATPTATSLPVVFIPGIGGTRLADANNAEYWPAAGYSGHAQLSLYPDPPHITLHPTNAITEATFLGFHIPSEDWQTYGPLFAYLGTQGFVQYDTHQNPSYQTSAGCDLTQAVNHPNLFVFAYDWRISNAQNAVLLADYIACVQKFYPNTNVNLVAHSMGGLVARRYILNHPGAHHVNAYVSVGTPFLGASKLIWVEETGEFIFFVWDSTVLDMVGSFNGASELMPSQAWYNSGGAPPLIENGQDLLGDGRTNEKLTYSQLVQYMNTAKGKQGFLPGTANQLFHNYSNGGNQQDDWSADTTGVKYYHIAGAGSQPDTITQVVAASLIKCLEHFSTCNLSTWMYPKFGIGDATVPILSTLRQGPNGNYNAPHATLYRCQGLGANNQNVDHTGMLSNPVVQGLLIQFLAEANGAPPAPPPDPLVCGSGGTSAPSKTGYSQLTLSGVTNVQLATDGVALAPGERPDGAAVYRVNADSVALVLAGGHSYRIEFETTGQSLYAEWLYRPGNKPKRAERYLDLPVAPGARAAFEIQGTDLLPLAYDADADNTIDALIPPTVSLSGKAARDVKPPALELTQVPARNGTRVTLSARDKASGIANIVYSLDGVHFQVYTEPFQVRSDAKTLYAFADDQAGNRSALQEFSLD